MHTLQERNTTFVTQKALALQMFGAFISSGMGIHKSCKVAGFAADFNDQFVWKRAKEIYVDFFGFLISLEDVMDDWIELSTHLQSYIYLVKFKNLSL